MGVRSWGGDWAGREWRNWEWKLRSEGSWGGGARELRNWSLVQVAESLEHPLGTMGGPEPIDWGWAQEEQTPLPVTGTCWLVPVQVCLSNQDTRETDLCLRAAGQEGFSH